MCSMGRCSLAARVMGWIGGYRMGQDPNKVSCLESPHGHSPICCVLILSTHGFVMPFLENLSFLLYVEHGGHVDLILQDTEWKGSQ